MKLPLLNTKNRILAAVVMATILFQSCSKDEITPEDRFEVAFNNETISFAKVDSVTASFSKIGQAPSFKKTLIRGIGENKYYLPKSELKEGTWDVTLDVYSTEDQGSRRKYELKKQFNDLTTTLTAPVIKAANEWKPFIILYNKPNQIEFIIPERQDQSTFEITVNKPWGYLYIERNTQSKTGQLVASKYWESNDPINGKIYNSTVFFDYIESLRNINWANTEILINLQNTGTGESCFLYYTYVNRYSPI